MPVGLLQSWFGELTGAALVFYLLGGLSLLALVIQGVLALVGAGMGSGGDHADFAADGIEHSTGGSFISIKTVTAFFFGLGWGGAWLLNLTQQWMLATAGGVFIGFGITGAMLLMMRGFSSLRTDGTVRLANAVNQVGTVYLTIPPKSQGGGQIQVTVQGQLLTVGAINSTELTLVNQSKVRVLSVIDEGTVLVAPL